MLLATPDAGRCSGGKPAEADVLTLRVGVAFLLG